MDEFKGILVKSVPEEVKEENKFAYAMLLSFVKTNVIGDKKQLSKRLKEELNKCNIWLERKKTFAAPGKEHREYIRKVAYLLEMRKLVRKYL